MLTDLWARRALIGAFATRDLATRYRSSALGWVWSLLQPLATLVVFAAVFSLVFKVQPPELGNGEPGNYAAFLFTGLVTWNLFTGLVNLSMTQLKSNGELLRKVQFPAWAPVIGASLVQLIQVGLELLVLIVMLAVLGNAGFTWLLAIPVLLGLALFAQGIGLVLSIANARYGDVQHIVTVVLGALYFATPILYPLALLGDQASVLRTIVEANPITWFVTAMHEAMYTLDGPSLLQAGGLLALGAAVFVIGLAIFDRASEDIGELL